MRLLILVAVLSLGLDLLTGMRASTLSRILSQTFSRKKSTAHFVVPHEGADETLKSDNINTAIINKIIIDGGGCYISTITTGNPPQDVLFILDTHNAETWTVPTSATFCLNVDPSIVLFSDTDTERFYDQVKTLPLGPGLFGIQPMTLFDAEDDNDNGNKNEDEDKEKEVQDDPSSTLLDSVFLRSAAPPGPEHSSGRNSTVAIRLAFLATVILVL